MSTRLVQHDPLAPLHRSEEGAVPPSEPDRVAGLIWQITAEQL